MSSARERAKVLADEIKKAVREAKLAEARAKQLGQELTQVLVQAKAEAETARTIVEYPTGRYECAKCRHSTVFTEPARELPACDNCGNRTWLGHEPTITKIEPPPPKKYHAGMYECGQCGVRTAVAEDTDALSACELCGADKLQPVES
jgi:Zn finger protein HypA/HybF involved in hydrogenase expression